MRLMPDITGYQVLAFQTKHLRESPKALEHQSPRKMLSSGVEESLGPTRWVCPLVVLMQL